MNDSHASCLVGVDGGGSCCRIATLWQGRRCEVSLAGAGANVTTDLPAAVAVIRRALKTVAAKAGLADEELAGATAYLGLAGVVSAAQARAVAALLPVANIHVEDDRAAAVVGALGIGEGTVVGVGTGSFLGRVAGGKTRLIGGWGLDLGDEASGAWLGRSLLSLVLAMGDGLEAHTPLGNEILAEFEGDGARIVAFARQAAPRDYARYAPKVVAAAKIGDPVAVDLMKTGADYIARGIAALGWHAPEPICLIGGVAPHYRGYLPRPMASVVISPVGRALDGALELAARMHARGSGSGGRG